MVVRKPEIQYVHQFYVYGSEAPAVQPKSQPRRSAPTLPKEKQGKVLKIFVDPVALCGVVLAFCMAVLLTVGVVQFNAARDANRQMSKYLSSLKQENVELQQTYNSKFDLAAVEEMARALGLVEVGELKTVTVDVVLPEPEAKPTFWENLVMDFRELFA